MSNMRHDDVTVLGEVSGEFRFDGDGWDIRVDDFAAIVHPAEEGGYWAEVPALPGCLTQGQTLDELRENLDDAIQGWLSVQTPKSLTALGVAFTRLPTQASSLVRMPRVRTLELAA